MKLVIAGSRHLNIPWEMVAFLVEQKPVGLITEVVSGGARGIDKAGEEYAEEALGLKPKMFLAKWKENGLGAGPIRNTEMANYADALFLIWDGQSPGSANMKQQMEALNKPIFEVILKY